MSEQVASRVRSIIDALGPLGDASAGEPVRADEWNRLVRAVVDLAHVALAADEAAGSQLESRFARNEHRHLGEVGPSWLDATAREQLEGFRGRLDLEQEVANTREAIREVTASVDRLREDVDGIRRRLLTVEDNDLGRGQRLQRVAAVVDSLEEQDIAIGEVRSNLHGLRSRVGEALSLRNQLRDPEGNPIDLVAIRTAIDSFAADRERLLDAAGEVVDARALQQRVERLESGPGGGGGGGPLPDLDRFREEVFAELDLRVTSRVEPVETNVAGVRAELADVRVAVDRQGTALDDTRTRFAAAEQRLNAVQGATTTIADLTTRVGRVESRVAGHGTRLDGFAALAGRVDAHDTALAAFDGTPERLSAVEGRLTTGEAVLARVPAMEVQVNAFGSVRADVQRVTSRLDEVASLAARADATSRAQETRLVDVEARTRDHRTRVDALESAQATQRNELSRLRVDLTNVTRPSGPLGPIGRIDVDVTEPFRPPGPIR